MPKLRHCYPSDIKFMAHTEPVREMLNILKCTLLCPPVWEETTHFWCRDIDGLPHWSCVKAEHLTIGIRQDTLSPSQTASNWDVALVSHLQLIGSGHCCLPQNATSLQGKPQQVMELIPVSDHQCYNSFLLKGADLFFFQNCCVFPASHNTSLTLLDKGGYSPGIWQKVPPLAGHRDMRHWVLLQIFCMFYSWSQWLHLCQGICNCCYHHISLCVCSITRLKQHPGMTEVGFVLCVLHSYQLLWWVFSLHNTENPETKPEHQV